MATNNYDLNNEKPNFRPQTGRNQTSWSSGSRSGSYSNYPSNNPSGNSVHSTHNHRGGWRDKNSYKRKFHDTPTLQVTAKNDETRAYAVNLQLKPVEMGIQAKNGTWTKEFQGLGAFNHYFGLCAPTNALGYTLADVWDGYFHITLAKFFSKLTDDQLEEVFKQFNPSLQQIPFIPNVVFRATTLQSCSGEHRTGNRKGIPFIVLSLDPSPQSKLFYDQIQLLLENIRQQAQAIDWGVTEYDKLHVTVRKYNKIEFPLEKIKVNHFPLEFRCSHLEIRQPRELAMQRFRKGRNNQQPWWIGVSEIDGKCSECNTPVISDSWEGFCLNCGKYETVRPLWMTEGCQTSDGLPQQKVTPDNTITTLVRNIALTDT